MNDITWSVVITTKNRFTLLKRAIDSAIRQSTSCEIVVVDDGSTDETATIAITYPSVKYVKNSSSIGHSASANIGIRSATGTWIKPLDDDDYLNSRCLETMATAIRNAPKERRPVLVSSAGINVDSKGELVSKYPRIPANLPVTLDSATLLKLMMLDQAPLGAPVWMGHHRQTALDCGGWNEKNTVTWGDDIEFWIRMAHRGGCVFLPEHLGYRTVWNGNGSTKVPVLQRYNIIMALKKEVGEVPRFVAASVALRVAIGALKEKDFTAAAKLLAIYALQPSALLQALESRRFTDAKRVISTLVAKSADVDLNNAIKSSVT
jgi:glycosyltransferase involved in cell wall biosynthesis